MPADQVFKRKNTYAPQYYNSCTYNLPKFWRKTFQEIELPSHNCYIFIAKIIH